MKSCKNCKYVDEEPYGLRCFGQKNAPTVMPHDVCKSWKPKKDGFLPDGFNPFYDSKFLVSYEDSDDRRYLVELYDEELQQLKEEIEFIRLRQIAIRIKR